MKKYILSMLFFLGCFFMCLSTNSNIVNAQTVNVGITTDSYDSRKITISLENLSPAINKIVVNEVAVCEAEDTDGCIKINFDGEKYIRILHSQEYEHAQTTTASLVYDIKSTTDGDKYFYVATYHFETNDLLSEYCSYFKHTLSTLSQRVVINPDASGRPAHEYDATQYTPVRKLNFTVELLEDELVNDYSGLLYVCEYLNEKITRCVEYSLGIDILEYYISSYGDGLKQINFYVVKKNQTVNSPDELNGQVQDKATLVSKKIYLDTIGPEISVVGGNWVYVEAGKTYTPQEATCKDAIFSEDTCSVSNDSNIVAIKYNVDEYQIITYEATDRLGNISSVAVKIKVEIAESSGNLKTYIIISSAVLVITGLILGWVLIKNNEKKKKMSYI